MTPFIKIKNNGPDIVETNFVDSDYAENGYFYLSTNAGCVRLLIPANQKGLLKELNGVTYVILSLGPWMEMPESGYHHC